MPEWSDDSQHRLTKVSYLLHLGHPIPAHFNVQAAFRLIESELQSQLANLNAHPSQTLDRVLLVNTAVLPRLLYRCECLPLTEQHLLSLTRPLEQYVLGVASLPSLIAHKRLYTHHTHGLGLRSLRILQPTRVLDSLHSNVTLHQLRTTTTFHLSPYRVFQAALQLLGPHRPPSMVPLTTTWNARRQIQLATEIVSVAGLRAYLIPNPSTHPDCTYTDGSKVGFPPAFGAAAVLQDGRIAVCRVPGAPNSYKAEVIGVLLGSALSPPNTTLRVDCKGAIASTTGTRRPVRHSHWVLLARDSLLRNTTALNGLRDTHVAFIKNIQMNTPSGGLHYPSPPRHAHHPLGHHSPR